MVLLAKGPENTTANAGVVARLNEPHRHYHNLRHVLEMWQWHKKYSDGMFNPEMIASFCLYHDAFCDPESKKNEARSADLWLRDCTGTQINLAEMVHTAITASIDHFHNHSWPCIRWCINLDLLRLGTPEPEFTQHGLDIRAEYGYLSDDQWLKKSAEWRAKCMAQPAIFAFPQFAEFERQARRNLANALLADWRAIGYLA
jgi:predicted metal-dependent HD superfamily phosphohydrolase